MLQHQGMECHKVTKLRFFRTGFIKPIFNTSAVSSYEDSLQEIHNLAQALQRTHCSGFVMSVYAHFGVSLPHK